MFFELDNDEIAGVRQPPVVPLRSFKVIIKNGGVGEWLNPAVLKAEIAVLLSDSKSN
jgi:hypothetical protein